MNMPVYPELYETSSTLKLFVYDHVFIYEPISAAIL
jgi:hypothetical protein